MNTKKSKLQSKPILPISDNFVYCEDVYQIWKNGSSLIRQKYYSSKTPIKKLSKEQFMKVFPDYKLVRFINLESAPEDYLINNGYEARHC